MRSEARGPRGEADSSRAVPIPLHWETYGDGPPVILLHGLGATSHTWRHWTPRLSEHFRVFAVDLKGFGKAPAPFDRRYAPKDQADLVFELIRAEGLSGLTLVGHSLGGGIAALVALRLLQADPGDLRGLVLVSAAVLPQPLSPFLRLLSRPLLGPLVLRVLPPKLWVAEALRRAYQDPRLVSDRDVEVYAAPFRSRGGRHALIATTRALRLLSTSPVPPLPLHALRVPTLLLWGSQDRVVPLTLARRAAQLLPDARLEVLENCGHVPQEEQPEASLARVIPFLSSLRRLRRSESP